jgi:hypothetical protein
MVGIEETVPVVALGLSTRCADLVDATDATDATDRGRRRTTTEDDATTRGDEFF